MRKWDGIREERRQEVFLMFEVPGTQVGPVTASEHRLPVSSFLTISSREPHTRFSSVFTTDFGPLTDCTSRFGPHNGRFHLPLKSAFRLIKAPIQSTMPSPHPKIKAVLFDLGGVVVGSPVGGIYVGQEVFQRELGRGAES